MQKKEMISDKHWLALYGLGSTYEGTKIHEEEHVKNLEEYKNIIMRRLENPPGNNNIIISFDKEIPYSRYIVYKEYNQLKYPKALNHQFSLPYQKSYHQGKMVN